MGDLSEVVYPGFLSPALCTMNPYFRLVTGKSFPIAQVGRGGQKPLLLIWGERPTQNRHPHFESSVKPLPQYGGGAISPRLGRCGPGWVAPVWAPPIPRHK